MKTRGCHTPNFNRGFQMVSQEVNEDVLIKDVVKRSLDIWATREHDEKDSKVYSDYSKYVFRKWAFIIVCVVAAIIVIGYALSVGDYPIPFFDCYLVIWDHIIGNIHMGLEDSIVFELRLPRIEMGILAGAGLAVAGVVMQSTMMNPLADSYTTGVSSGASLGATIGIVLGFSLFNVEQYGTVLNAFVFSLVPMAAIVSISKIKNASPTTMIMGGIAIMYLFNAITTVITLMANPDQLQDLYRWSVGSLGFAAKEDIPVVAAITIPVCIIMMLLTKKLNALASGDESAKALGIDAERLRRICLVLVALMVASIVSFSGLIGFVGLVAPHIVRIFVGADNRYLLPASAAFGALLLVLSDLIGRMVIAPAILQVGVVTAFLGGPLFLWLILRKNSTVW